MARRERDGRVQRSLFSWRSYVLVLLAFSAATTISLAFLFHDTAQAAQLTLERRVFAALNFFGVCAAGTFLWGLWRRKTTQEPVERILSFTRSVADGDFGARIPERTGAARNEFDVIAADLNRMAGELASVETLRSDFVASVSHEMKTPLAIISNYATILQDPTLSAGERAEAAAKCGEAARRLSGMVGDILRLNKLENQVIVPEAAPFDLSEQLAACVLAHDEAIEAKGLVLCADIQPGVRVRGDADLFELVWNNLLSNACKFSDEGGRVTVALEAHGGEAEVRVADAGCGFTQGEARHIFEKFYQADGSHAAEGNGLGLALAKRVCDLSGAQIRAQGEPGEGAVFTVTLPACGE